MAEEGIQGKQFEEYWSGRSESGYTHWTRGDVKNQVQLAFRNHWEILCQFMDSSLYGGGKRILEVGSGRGSLSMYFADAGYDCTLLDISPYVLAAAENLYRQHKLAARFVEGDVMALPFEAGSFDLIFSIGLLEHITNFQASIREQARVLAAGGLLVAYVVPYYDNNIQSSYRWVNAILRGYHNLISHQHGEKEKEQVKRTDTASPPYIEAFKKVGMIGVDSSGAYPLPLISHSPDFPFSLMPPESEAAVVSHFTDILDQRRQDCPAQHPWFCEEGYGQAFYVWGYKPIGK